MNKYTIVFASVEWDMQRVVSQPVSLELSKCSKVIYINPVTFIRKKTIMRDGEIKKVNPNLIVYQPKQSLLSYRLIHGTKFFNYFYSFSLFSQVSKLLNEISIDQLEIYICLPSQLNIYYFFKKQIENTKLVYLSIDDNSVFNSFFQNNESNVVNESKLVLTFIGDVKNKLSSLSKTNNVLRYFPGVDTEIIKAIENSHSTPEDLKGLNRPIVGFSGSIDNRVDLQLISQLANRLPNCSFVFVGPIVGSIVKPNMPNIFFLGNKAREELGSYLNNFDILIMPYKIHDKDFQEKWGNIFPAKTLEYFATGKPVISSQLKELKILYEEGLLYLTNNNEGFEKAIINIIENNHPEENEGKSIARKKIANSNMWSSIVEDINRRLEL